MEIPLYLWVGVLLIDLGKRDWREGERFASVCAYIGAAVFTVRAVALFFWGE